MAKKRKAVKIKQIEESAMPKIKSRSSKKKPLSFKKYKKAIEKVTPETRKALYKIREQQKKGRTKYEAEVLAGERSRFKKLRLRMPKSSRKITKRIQIGTQRLLTAAGILPGRPKGTYKYGMPIHKYKQLQAKKKVMFQAYQQEQQSRLVKRGLAPEQIQQLQTVRSAEQPPQPTHSVPDEELQFRKWLAQRTVSPNTQRLLDNLRRTQLKAKSDDVEMQRRIRERKMVSHAGSLLNTPFIFKDHNLNMTGVDGDNILKAPNIFKDTSMGEDNILRQKRLSILQTRAGGNDLGF